jgi:AcrR family transcriptional regulator
MRAAANGSQSGANRERLLVLGASLFATQGYAQVSVRDLAARIGVTTGAIYSNFNSKGELLAAVLDVRITADMERSERSRPGSWLPQVVHGSFLRASERGQMRALLLEAAAASRTDPELRDSLRPTLTALINRWINDYRAWQRTGDVDPDVDMADLLTVLWAIELGIGVLEAQGAMRIKAVALADFIGGFLQSLEGEGAVRPRDIALHHFGFATVPPQTRKGARSSSVARPTANRPPPHEPHGEPMTPTRLIDVATELFAEKGYGAVTVRDLARATGLTTGSIYGNFANKALLLVEAIETLITRVEDLPASLLESGSPMEQVEFHLQNFSERARLRALLIEGAAAARSDRAVHDRLQDMELRHLDLWVAGSERWLAVCPSPPTVDMHTAVATVWSAELGLALLEALDLSTPSPSRIAAVFRRMFSAFGLARTEVGPTGAVTAKGRAGGSSGAPSQ